MYCTFEYPYHDINNRLYNTCVYLERELSHLIDVNHDLPTEIKSVYPRQIVGTDL